MRKGGLVAYIVIFFAVCAVPGVTLLSGVESPNYENRTLAALPALWDENGFNRDFPSRFDAYFSENFGLRSLLVTANAALRAALLHDSADGQVILGEDGWLYFGETLDEYLGRGTLTDEQIARLARALALQREILAARGVAFLVALSPDKNTVYPEYMPSRLVPQSGENNLDALQAAMTQAGVAYADLKAALLAAREEGQLYHKLDTHWNNRGALTAYRTLLAAVAGQLPGFEYDEYRGASSRVERRWSGDLSVMLFPALNILDDQVVYDIGTLYRAVRPYHTARDISIQTASDVNETGLLVFRDSFCDALLPLLSNAFGQALYSRAVPYDYSLLDETGAQVVILEIVERNIPELLEYAPLLQAPLRDAPSLSLDTPVSAAAGVREAGDGWVIYGSADRSGAARVRLEGSGGDAHYYEPFPILSADDAAALSGGGGNGFTMYLDADALPAGDYAVSVVVECDGVAAASGTLATVTVG